jgi:glycosyltransferase involved in cell wall biosynthesis
MNQERQSRGLAGVIPAYNEVATIRDVAERTLAQLPEVIVVDDGSTDGTADALAGLPVTLVRNPRNLGKAASLWRGISLALAEGAQAVVTLDADGQHRPEDIPRLLAAHRRDTAALVVGARLHDGAKIPAERYYANRFANFWIAWAAGQRVQDSQSGFRVYPAPLLLALPPRVRHAAGFVFESEALIEAGRRGTRLEWVPIPAIYQARGRPSHFRPIVDVALITRMVAWKLLSRGLDLRGLVRSLRGA